jgi:hypothetical protein
MNRTAMATIPIAAGTGARKGTISSIDDLPIVPGERRASP